MFPKFIYILSTLLLTVVGCDNSLDRVVYPDLPKVIYFQTNLPAFTKPTTKMGTANETDLDNNIWVWVFESDVATERLHFFKKCTADATGKVVVDMKTTNKHITVVFLANAPATYLDKFGTTLNFDDITESTYSTLSELREALNTTLLLEPRQTIVPYTPNHKIPMSAVKSYSGGTADITNATNAIGLIRIVSKITVENKATATFNLAGIAAGNAPRNGSLLPPLSFNSADFKNNTGNLTNYIGSSVGSEVTSIAQAVGEKTDSNPLYLYEAKEDDKLFLILQGSYSGQTYYYKIVISKDYTDVNNVVHPANRYNRNFTYNFIIREVTSRGYVTLNDAIAGEESNIIYDVEVTDLKSQDIVDNGQYYIGVSNSEFIAYVNEARVVSNPPLVAFTLNTGNYKEYAGVPYPAQGKITSATPGLKIISSTIFNHPAVDLDIEVEFETDFYNGGGVGTINIELGNISKSIVVRQRTNTLVYSPIIQFNNDFISDVYRVAEIVPHNGNDPTWIRINDQPITDLLQGKNSIVSNYGGIYIAYNTSVSMPAQFVNIYISKSNYEGRVKVHLELP